MPCAGGSWQVGWLAMQGLLRQPGEGNGFQIIAVHTEHVCRLHAAVRQQGSEAGAQSPIMCATAAKIYFRCAGAMLPNGLRDCKTGQLKQRSLHIFRLLSTLQLAAQPRHAEQVAAAASWRRQGKEGLAEHSFQQCRQYPPG